MRLKESRIIFKDGTYVQYTGFTISGHQFVAAGIYQPFSRISQPCAAFAR